MLQDHATGIAYPPLVMWVEVVIVCLTDRRFVIPIGATHDADT